MVGDPGGEADAPPAVLTHRQSVPGYGVAMAQQPWQVALPLRVVPQPNPFITRGGDCGYCVLAGLLGISVQEVYDECGDDPQRQLGSRDRWVKAANRWAYAGKLDAVFSDIPIWPWTVPAIFMDFGLLGPSMGMPWFAFVRMALEAGYYAVAWVDHGRAGPLGHGSDHVVMICGARHRFEPSDDGDGTGVWRDEVLVSCSSRATPAEEWVSRNAFLRDRGGYAVVLVRPV